MGDDFGKLSPSCEPYRRSHKKVQLTELRLFYIHPHSTPLETFTFKSITLSRVDTTGLKQ